MKEDCPSISDLECEKYVIKRFENIYLQKLIDKPIENFEFTPIDSSTILSALDGLSSTSSPGCSEIPMQIIKNSKNKLLPIFVELFNECLPW